MAFLTSTLLRLGRVNTDLEAPVRVPDTIVYKVGAPHVVKMGSTLTSPKSTSFRLPSTCAGPRFLLIRAGVADLIVR